jgi:hypothetical protein
MRRYPGSGATLIGQDSVLDKRKHQG